MGPVNLAFATGYDAVQNGAQPSRPGSTLTLDSGLELAVYNDLAAVESTWRGFQRNADCTAFQTFEWLSAWQRHIGSPSGVVPAIVVVRDSGGAILLVLPLATRPIGFARELVWLGSEHCDYNAPLLAADYSARVKSGEFLQIWRDAMQLLQAHPRSHFDLVRLDKMPEAVRSQQNPMLELTTTLHPSGSYATPLARTWDAFYAAKRSPSTRRRDRTKRNRLAELGDIKLVNARNPDEALDAMATLVRQKSAQFARLGVPDLFARPGYVEFLRAFAGGPEASGLVHISELRVGSQVAAVNFALTLGHRYYHVLSSYADGELARFGPGAIHLHELLRYAIENEFTIFDFTVGDERYKLDWCDGTQLLHDHISTSTWRGSVVAAPMRLLKKIKRTIKQTPVLWAGFNKGRVLGAKLRATIQPRQPNARGDAR
jgi:CelD/BcsL family acetyltransferase involved in cellulose biosynthesis